MIGSLTRSHESLIKKVTCQDVCEAVSYINMTTAPSGSAAVFKLDSVTGVIVGYVSNG